MDHYQLLGHALIFLLGFGIGHYLYQFFKQAFFAAEEPAVVSQEHLAVMQDLVKALNAGIPSSDSGSPLVIEDLSPTMALVTFTQPDWWKQVVYPAPLHILHPGRAMDEMLWATRPHIIDEWDLDYPHIGQKEDDAERVLLHEARRLYAALPTKAQDKAAGWPYPSGEFETAIEARYNVVREIADDEGVI